MNKENKTMVVVSTDIRDKAKMVAAANREKLQDFVERVLSKEISKTLGKGKK